MNPELAAVALYGRMNGLTDAQCDELWHAMGRCAPAFLPSIFLQNVDMYISTIRIRQDKP